MAVSDVNCIQYRSATNRNFESDFETYLTQSLANLGQRLGVKGDSVKSGSFSFRDLFDEAKTSSFFNSLSHIGVIERRYGVMYLSIVPKSTLSVGKGESAIEHSVYGYGNTLVFDTSKEIKSSIETIDAYSPNSFISTLKNNKYVFCGIGQKKIDDIYTNVEFVYEEFDRDTDEIISALRICVPDGSNNVLMITYNRLDANSVDIEVFNIGNNPLLLNSTLEKIETLLQSLNKINNSTSGASNESRINSMSIDYWVNYLKLPRYGNNYDILSNIQFKFGEEKTDNPLSLENLSSVNQSKLNLIAKKYGNNVKTTAYLFQYDKKDTLPVLKEYFTDSLYAASKTSFREQIICAIFNGIYPLYPNNAKIFVPVDYIFNYYCNSNDSWKIYGGIQDINVRFVNTSITRNNIRSYYVDDQLIANISGDDQTALFNYSVQYSEDNPDLVYAVNVEKKYTLPYINSDNVWVINNQITNIPASGKDAGNPNIIIIYNYNKNEDSILNKDFKILAAADKDSVLSGMGWKIASTYVEPIERINLEDPAIVTKSDKYKIACRIPNLAGSDNELQRSKALNILEYSLIINISSVACFDKINSEIRERYGDYGVVTTLWKFDSKTTSFLPITNPKFDNSLENVALDIINLTNLNNLVKWHIMNHEPKHPDRYTHSWLVFDNAKQETKNSINDWRTYVFPVIQNKTAEEISAAQYVNDFNLYVKFNDAVSGAIDNDIRGVSNSGNKYLTYTRSNVVNSLYYTQTSSTNIKNYLDWIPNVDMPMLTLSEVFTKDLNLLNRSNIISFNQQGYMFYSYIGTAFDDNDKNRVHIGGSETNINFGNETMVSNSNRKLFKRPTELHFDFENTFTNGYSYVQKDLIVYEDIKTSHINWEVRKMTNYTVYSTMFVPTSKLMNQSTDNEDHESWMSIIQFNNQNIVIFRDDNKYEQMTLGQIKRYANNAGIYTRKFGNEYDYKLWIPSFYYNHSSMFKKTHIYYIGEFLYLPGLLGRLRLDAYNTMLQNVIVTSNMELIKYNDKPIMLRTSNTFLENIDFSNSVDSTSTTASFSISNNTLYTGHPLEISYYIQYGNLYITINEVVRNQKINNLFKIKTDY